jgi:hypothetical protein
MILAHSVLGGDVAEHVILLLIVSSHAPLDALCAVPLQDFRFFSILLGLKIRSENDDYLIGERI